MEKQSGWSLAELAEILGGTLDGPGAHRVYRPVPADEDAPDGIAFAEGAYVERALASGVGALILPEGAENGGKPTIRHARPRAAFGHFLALNQRPLPLATGISDQAWISPTAEIDSSAKIGAFSVVESGAKIGANVRVYPFAYVGEGCVLEEGATLYPHVVLVQDVTVGKGAIIHPGAVLGADGFGFVWDGKRRIKVPQVGRVELSANVEIGANSAVDRATAGATRLREGVKIDNLVQVGHNTQIGAHTVLTSQVGISGSTVIGERCILAGQVGTKDHVTIGDDIRIGGKSGVVKDLSRPGEYLGFPAQPAMQEMRSQSLVRKLPELLDRIRQLEKRLEELER